MNNELNVAIRNIINRHDPAGVIYDESTIDEYDSEVTQILGFLKNNLSKEKLSEKIYHLFVESFSVDIAGDQNKYNLLAEEILELPELNNK